MKLKIEIKHWITGALLFEFETDNNSIKKTLEQARSVGAYLTGAYLRGADLTGAYLRGADLRGAYLRGAYLRGADLTGAYLRGADLTGAYLRGAYLRGADLTGADLRGADLTGAYLRGAYLRGADLTGAYLRGAEKEKMKIKTCIVFSGLYKYVVIPYITQEDVKRVKMGCHDRTVEEWDADFWNNPGEFPNTGDLDSKLRVMAYETAKKWFELIAS